MSEQVHDTYDVVFLGGGPCGYVSAVRASQLGLKSAVVEQDKVGGTCLHWGCIPTKAMLHAAELCLHIKEAKRFGITAAKPEVDWPAVMKRVGQVVGKLHRGTEYLLKSAGAVVVPGRGRLAAPGLVHVTSAEGKETEVRGRHVVVGTGTVPTELPSMPFDGKTILSSDDMFRLEKLPKSLLVVGAGFVGVEFATIMSAFGVDVTMVEMLPQVLPLEDEEMGGLCADALKRQGIKVMTASMAKDWKKQDGGVAVTVESEGGKSAKLAVEQILVSVGRRPRTADLGLEELGVKIEKGFIEVDAYGQTACGAVHAAGDVVATPALAHVAYAEGELIVERIASRPVRPINYDRIPRVTFAIPEVAAVGLTEQQCEERGYPVKIGRYPLRANSKAVVQNEDRGMVKVITHAGLGEVLGVHIMGPHASDLLGEATAVMEGRMRPSEIGRAIHAHPTLSEALKEAFLDVGGEAIHKG